MKYLKSIVVIFLLFGLPVGSWYFLQYGLDWRREKSTQLVPKMDLKNEVSWSSDDLAIVTSKFMNKTTLLICAEQDVANIAIVDQFKDAFTFQSIDASELPQSIVKQLGGENLSYLLIDTGMVVRQTYVDSKKTTVQRLVEDLALTIPQPKVKELKLRGRHE